MLGLLGLMVLVVAEIMDALPRINDAKKIAKLLNREMLLFETNLQVQVRVC